MAKKSSLTDEQVKEYRECFNLFDKDGDQTISTAELLTVMKSLGHNPSNEEVTSMIEEVDENGNGKIEFSEFLTLMEKQLNNFESEKLIRQAFEVIDYEGNGYIMLKQLRHVVHDLGLSFTDEEMSDMIDEADPSGDGRVSYQGVRDLFLDSHVTLSAEARKRWEFLKKRPFVRKKKDLKRVKSAKAPLKRLPGKRISRKEKANRERFSKLSLTSSKVTPVKKVEPGVSNKSDRDRERNNTSVVSNLTDRSASSSTPIKASAVRKLFAQKPGSSQEQTSPRRADKDGHPQKKIVENSGSVVKFLHKKLSSFNTDAVRYSSNSDRDTEMKTKVQSNSGSPTGGHKGANRERHRRDTDLYEEGYDLTFRQENDSALPPINERNNHDTRGSPQTSRKLPVHERLYDPDYRKHRTANPEPEPVYNRDFKAKLPKNLEHVTSKFMDPEYFEPKQEPEKEVEEFQQFKAYVPKQLEHVKSKILDPGYYEPKGEYVLDVEEHQAFRARLPKNLEHVQSRHLNQEYFQKRQSPDPALYEPQTSRFTARVPKGMEHVESRILDDKYFAPKTYPEREENFDTEFKAHVPRYLEHIESRLLYPKKPKPIQDDTDVFQTNFKAKPPRRFEHVESRILDPVYFEPKPSYMVEEDEELNTEFKSRPPKALQHVEKRIYEPRYFQKKEQKPTTEDREVQNMNTDFKAKIPKSMQHVKSKAYDQAMAMTPSRMSDTTSLVELKKKGPVVVIKVKKDESPRQSNTGGYMDRLQAEKMQDKDYYKQWRKEFEDQVRDIRGDNQTLEQKPVEDKVVVTKRTSKKEPEKKEEVKEEKEEKKERKPWKPRRQRREVFDREVFDSWVMTPTHLYTEQNDMFMSNRRHVSAMWNNLATTIDKNPNSPPRIRSVDRYF